MKLLLSFFVILLLACCKQIPKEKLVIIKKSGKSESPKGDSGLTKSEGQIIKLNTFYTFDKFTTEIYTGTLASPDFNNNPFSNDKKYVDFINDGCKIKGINFAGHYTIIERSCGAMCEHIFVVDRITGKIFTDVKPDDGRYGYQFKANSSLLIANSNLFVDDKLEYYNNFWGKPELYKWDNEHFERLN